MDITNEWIPRYLKTDERTNRPTRMITTTSSDKPRVKKLDEAEHNVKLRQYLRKEFAYQKEAKWTINLRKTVKTKLLS